jgi:hypothetical protein
MSELPRRSERRSLIASSRSDAFSLSLLAVASSDVLLLPPLTTRGALPVLHAAEWGFNWLVSAMLAHLLSQLQLSVSFHVRYLYVAACA